MTARASFGHFLELLAALEAGKVPRSEVRAWFLLGADAWARSANSKTLHEHLGLSRRLRRDYLTARLRDHLDDALQAFVETRQGTAWNLAAEFVAELKRFERRDLDRDPGASRLSRSLWAAFRIGLPIPMSREHWFFSLKAMTSHGSVRICSDDQEMHATAFNEIRRRAKGAWEASDELRRAHDLSDFLRETTEQARRQYESSAAAFDADARAQFASCWEFADAQLEAWIEQQFPKPRTAAAPNTETTSTMSDPKTQVDPQAAEAQARRQWDTDAQLRAEFGNDKEAWLAYVRASSSGLFKVIGRR